MDICQSCKHVHVLGIRTVHFKLEKVRCGLPWPPLITFRSQIFFFFGIEQLSHQEIECLLLLGGKKEIWALGKWYTSGLLLPKKKKNKSALHFGSDRGQRAGSCAIKPKRMEIGPGSLSPAIGPLKTWRYFFILHFYIWKFLLKNEIFFFVYFTGRFHIGINHRFGDSRFLQGNFTRKSLIYKYF